MKRAFKLVVLILSLASVVQVFASANNTSKEPSTGIKVSVRGHVIGI